MASAIPIQNLYYLLSYAWDLFRPGEQIDIPANSCPDLANLLAKVLASGIHGIARSGFDKRYLEQTDVISRLRGRVLVMPSYRRGTHLNGRMQCEFDELSFDTPANRILAATCRSLLSCLELTAENRKILRHSASLIPYVSSVRVTGSCFHRVQLHRNTRSYRLVLSVCRLIHQCLLPEEEPGQHRFRDILRDKTVMHRLFEHFVFYFAKRHLRGASVSAMVIQWQASELSTATESLLPGMRTDVTVAWPDRKLILDCKYYPDALTSRSDPRFGSQGFHSSHLYQLNAYLTNKAFTQGWEMVEGMLLYPTNGYHLEHSFVLHGKHRVRVQTLDLAASWPKIENDLKSYFSEPCVGTPTRR
jgi:5-methylcytosine-specific restriction enzyme subunit McrC